MGGVASGLIDAVKTEGPALLRSSEAVLAKTEIGKFYVDTIKNKLEPEAAKLSQTYLSTGMQPQEAMAKGKDSVKKAIFGKNNNGLIAVAQGVQKQGGPMAAQHLMDFHNIYFAEDALTAAGNRMTAIKKGVQVGTDPGYKGVKVGGMEAPVKKLNQAVSLPLISIPHAAQAPLNSLAVFGFRDTMKAMAEFAKDGASAKALAHTSGAMVQETAYGILSAQKGTSPYSLLIDPLRKVFSMERRAGIAYSAVIGKHSAIEAADTFFKSGGKDNKALIQLKLLGQDPSLVMSQGGKLSQENIETAAFRSASEIMGFRSGLETPMYWESNAAWRLGTTFKQYGFRTMKLHADSLKRAYASEGMVGVAKKAAMYATVFPIAGELIKGAEGIATLQNPWSDEKQKNNFMGNEYADAIATAMGFNLIYSATRAATYHKLGNFLMGPIFGTASDLMTDVMASDPRKNATWEQAAQRKTENVVSDLMRHSGLVGRILGPHYRDYLKQKRKSEKSNSSY